MLLLFSVLLNFHQKYCSIIEIQQIENVHERERETIVERKQQPKQKKNIHK